MFEADFEHECKKYARTVLHAIFRLTFSFNLGLMRLADQNGTNTKYFYHARFGLFYFS